MKKALALLFALLILSAASVSAEEQKWTVNGNVLEYGTARFVFPDDFSPESDPDDESSVIAYKESGGEAFYITPFDFDVSEFSKYESGRESLLNDTIDSFLESYHDIKTYSSTTKKTKDCTTYFKSCSAVYGSAGSSRLYCYIGLVFDHESKSVFCLVAISRNTISAFHLFSTLISGMYS